MRATLRVAAGSVPGVGHRSWCFAEDVSYHKLCLSFFRFCPSDKPNIFIYGMKSTNHLAGFFEVQGVSEAVLQMSIDCAQGGVGGVDCTPINTNGACFLPDTRYSHVSWAITYPLRYNSPYSACHSRNTIIILFFTSSQRNICQNCTLLLLPLPRL
ncbi:hypothetical protein M758_8G045800 [Ceratodon purpureus]|nr:hypothetical protein M758_8G045800 [Ceratodon purpureus]